MKNKGIKIIITGITMLTIFVNINAASGKMGSNYRKNTMKSRKNGYIGINRARSIALSKVPGANSSHVVNLHFDYEDGRPVYEGKIYFRGLEYEFDIDAVSGRIVSWDVDRD